MGISSSFKDKNDSPAAGVGTLLVAGVLVSSRSLNVSAGVGTEETDSLPKIDPPLRRVRLVAFVACWGELEEVTSFASSDRLVKRRDGLVPFSSSATLRVSARLLTEVDLVDLPLGDSMREVR